MVRQSSRKGYVQTIQQPPIVWTVPISTEPSLKIIRPFSQRQAARWQGHRCPPRPRLRVLSPTKTQPRRKTALLRPTLYHQPQPRLARQPHLPRHPPFSRPPHQLNFQRCRRQACNLQHLPLLPPPPFRRPHSHKQIQEAVKIEETISSKSSFPVW